MTTLKLYFATTSFVPPHDHIALILSSSRFLNLHRLPIARGALISHLQVTRIEFVKKHESRRLSMACLLHFHSNCQKAVLLQRG